MFLFVTILAFYDLHNTVQLCLLEQEPRLRRKMEGGGGWENGGRYLLYFRKPGYLYASAFLPLSRHQVSRPSVALEQEHTRNFDVDPVDKFQTHGEVEGRKRDAVVPA